MTQLDDRPPAGFRLGVSDISTSSEAAPSADFDAPLIRDGVIHGVSPADARALPPVPCTPVAEVSSVVARVREAAKKHAARDLETRASMLRGFRAALMRRGDAIAAAVVQETGKPEAEVWLHEIVPTADLAKYWSTEGPALLASSEPELDALSYPGKRAVVERAARGVVGLITPWNFPVALPLRALFPALLAGNGIVFKPSEHTPRCGALVAAAAAEVYGPDLVAVVQGAGDVGAALIAGGVDAVIFTGSVATGRKVAHAAADVLIPVSLELGGKDAALVLEDADVERAARGILWGAFANAGQNCAAVERVYAVRSVAPKLEQRLAALAKELVLGRDVGPLSNAAQLATVERHVRGARDRGAKVLAGGARSDRKGLWFEPTVLGDVPAEAEALVEETFGPVLPVIAVQDEEEAVAAANQSRYGLTASVWTRDLQRGETVARRLRAGVVMVNNHGFSGAVPSLPWTGVGESGYGITNSPHALDALTRPRAILVDTSRGKRELWWHPYTPSLLRIGRSMATLRAGRGSSLGAKVKAFFRLLGAFAKRWKAT